jgi:hypothetical protein
LIDFKGGFVMEITARDIGILRWIMEQKVITEEQIRKVFWKDKLKDDREAYRRLSKLKEAGYLKTNTTGLYQRAIYLITRKGLKELKASDPKTALKELSDKGYSSYIHDLIITDLRILFEELGFTHWISRRMLRKERKLMRTPDALIYSNGKHFAIEYGPSKKSKASYKKIFLSYELSNQIDKVIYIVDTKEHLKKIAKYGCIYHRLHFVTLEDIKRNKMNARLLGSSSGSHSWDAPIECSLHELLWGGALGS